MKFTKTIPILYSANVIRSLDYYTDVLGFDGRWDWGQPPTFGGVYRNEVQLFFCEKGQGNPGTWISIMVDDVDGIYEQIAAQKEAIVISPPENKEWGIREMLIGDPDGHRIRFGQPVSARTKSKPTLPDTVRIVNRVPSAAEVSRLARLVGWSSPSEETRKQIALSMIPFAVVAENTITGEAIGCAFLLGDQAGFYYVKDVIVDPAWQGMQVGTALMQALTDWLDAYAPDKSFVGLHTGENLAPFYRQFGFAPFFGMQRTIHRDKTDQ